MLATGQTEELEQISVKVVWQYEQAYLNGFYIYSWCNPQKLGDLCQIWKMKKSLTHQN